MMDAISRRNFLKTAGLLTLTATGGPLVATDALAGVANDGMPVRKARMLRPGDTIAITAPASAVFKEGAVAEFEAVLRSMGFEVVQGQSLRERRGYLAGSDELRAKELNELFANPVVKGIFTIRGGWGSARILPMLDFDIIRQNPKVIMGFSDITALLNAIYARTGLITFHGPVGYSNWNDFSVEFAHKVWGERHHHLRLENPDPHLDPIQTIRPGEAKGRLIGGNLAVIASLAGTGYLPDFQGKILFVEEINEEIYRIDRLFTQLKLAGLLEKLAGFVFGKCVSCEADASYESLSLMDVLHDHIEPLGIPAFYGLMVGHIKDKFTIPIGAEAEINARKGTLKLLESAVS